ncbi:hypothetical protein BDW75DRAFT_108545 [Aspergillus navahoensis]
MMASPGIHKWRASALLGSKTEQQRKRKRLQNRISQQCFREKQASYIKHLEQFVESIEHSDGFAGTEAAERLRLIRENHALRDSLMHMRKKLLSLGAQVTSLASMHPASTWTAKSYSRLVASMTSRIHIIPAKSRHMMRIPPYPVQQPNAQGPAPSKQS